MSEIDFIKMKYKERFAHQAKELQKLIETGNKWAIEHYVSVCRNDNLLVIAEQLELLNSNILAAAAKFRKG